MFVPCPLPSFALALARGINIRFTEKDQREESQWGSRRDAIAPLVSVYHCNADHGQRGGKWFRTYLGHEYYVLRTRPSSHDSRKWEGIHDALDMAQQAPARPLLSTSPSSPSRGILSRMRPSEASSVKLDACQRRFVGLMPCAQSQQAV